MHTTPPTHDQSPLLVIIRVNVETKAGVVVVVVVVSKERYMPYFVQHNW